VAEESGTLRVVVADDQPVVRAGFAGVLASAADIDVVGTAADGSELVALVERESPDVAVVDVRMPVMDGIAATAALTRDHATRVLVLTTFDLDESAARAIKAGASGFVLKDADPEFLLAAIRTVHAGNSVIAASATTALLQHFTDMPPAPLRPKAFASLTAREEEVFRLVARGLSNAEIAAHEYLSEATVKTHISRIFTKLGLRDRVQLVVYAFEHGLT